MLREERLQLILDKLSTEKRVSSIGLSEWLGVSDDTIRRDLHELATKGLLKKVHGGAIAKPKGPLNYQLRLQHAFKEKEALAQKCLSLLSPETVIILDAGTTNLKLAELLPPTFNATIYTNSLAIAQALILKPQIEVILLGGKLFKEAQDCVGPETLQALEKLRADTCIIGTCSIHPEIGLTTPYREEAFVKEAMVNCSNNVIAMATNEKLHTASPYIVCPTEAIDTLVVEDKEKETHLPFTERGLILV